MKKNKFGELPLPDSQPSYTGLAIETACYQQNDRHRDKWNRRPSPETDPYTHGQVLSAKEPRQFSRERKVFSTNGAKIIQHPCVKRVVFTHTLHHIKIN